MIAQDNGGDGGDDGDNGTPLLLLMQSKATFFFGVYEKFSVCPTTEVVFFCKTTVVFTSRRSISWRFSGMTFITIYEVLQK